MTPEGAVVKAVMDLLAAERIPAWRMQSGAMSGEHNGKLRFFRFGEKGMADILAFPMVRCIPEKLVGHRSPLWIECKANRGRQSEEQKAFEKYVTDNGMDYIVARSSDDVLAWLKSNGVER